MTHPPTDPEPMDVIAREIHEHARQRVTWRPAWEDLDMTDPFEAGLIQSAYDRALAWVEMHCRDGGGYGFS